MAQPIDTGKSKTGAPRVRKETVPEMDEEVLEQLIRRILEQDPVVSLKGKIII